ncbi:putative tRNA pseudouridine synthase Pus10 [Diabrotica undecimpunctata]|uniref:putative tRNA pseudouridine synthase Pus10 n=1 Tax=Diabrotica undecimpunctata TaxID=50387 RepID=UPI003B63F62E
MKVNIPDDIKSSVKSYLEELECCKRCVLRYLGYSIYDEGERIYAEEQNGVTENTDNLESQNPAKKMKANPCRVCLDILSEQSMENYLTTFPSDFEDYKIPSVTTCATLPTSVILREHSMLVALRNKFPNIYAGVNLKDLECSKRIFKTTSSLLISQKINKAYSPTAKFQVNINIKYEDDTKDTEGFIKAHPKVTAKLNLAAFLNTYRDDKFKEVFPVPPEIPNKSVSAEISYTTDPVYLGGRYLKFSREMGQTPFIVNNVAVTESSVQETIFPAISEVLGCSGDQMVFSASGREDSDTRMLGTGRPFYIQIKQPKFNSVSREQCRTIEKLIMLSNTVVVRKLQEVFQKDLKIVKEGEQEKRKTYLALCKTQSPDLPQTVDLINRLSKPLVLQQKTPIRVLHRRSQLVRERLIYDFEATAVEGRPDLFCLKLVTQAGTYVKEFVHGDFDRTCPNLTQCTGYLTDVVALDVTGVELEWPPQDGL